MTINKYSRVLCSELIYDIDNFAGLLFANKIEALELDACYFDTKLALV